MHMMCAHELLRGQFPQYDGLKPTVLQQSKSVKSLPPDSIQILHTRGNHWIAISTINCEQGTDVYLYDSLYSELSIDTQVILAKLVRTSKSVLYVNVVNVQRQSGTSDCGLFAIANITHIAFGLNPCMYMFKQEAMRQHFLQCIEKEKMEPFPTLPTLRSTRLSTKNKIVNIEVFCYCRCPDDGSKMVGCDNAHCKVEGNWFHEKCIDYTIKKKQEMVLQTL